MPVASGHPQRRWANGREARLWHFCITPAPDFTLHYPEKTRHRFGCAFPRAGRIYWRRSWSPAWKGILFLNVLFWWQLIRHHSGLPSPSAPRAVSLPSPSDCTFLTLPLQLHTYSSWFSLTHTRTRSLSHPKHTHYCSIPAKGFFPIAVWVNKSKYEKTETDTHSFQGKHHLSNSVRSWNVWMWETNLSEFKKNKYKNSYKMHISCTF